MSVIISCHPFKLEKNRGGLNVENIAVGRLMIGRVPGENNKRWNRERTGCAGVKAAAFRQSTEPRERAFKSFSFFFFLSCCCFSTRKNSCASFSRETTLGSKFIRRKNKKKNAGFLLPLARALPPSSRGE